ncbi:MAG: nuclear transport factor 2 family protein [Alphaproteobacteria bacterium]|nr:nuclear transport factor 2 family protein [Alphaproteobacteria bacterium]
MTMTKQQMDEAVNAHFGFEAADDLDGVMASLAPDVEHEVVPSPMGVQTDRDRIRAFYAMLFESIRGEGVTPLKRYYGEDFVIDETLWHGEIKDGRPFLCDGRSGKVSFRLLHLFEFKSGKIAREQAWCDLAAIQRQLGVAAR